MKKILIVANVDNFHKNFHLPYIEALHKNNWQVDLASKGDMKFDYIKNKFDINFGRKPFKINNLQSFLRLKKIVNSNYYDVIFCNTPVPGFITRLASIKAKSKGSKVIYSAHGYSFYKGNNKLKNSLFILLEKYLSNFSDIILTMNKEDYECSKRYKFKAKIINVNGVGVNLEKYVPISTEEKIILRNLKGFSKDDYILIYPAELTIRKNQTLLFEIVKELKNKIVNLKLLLAGTGILHEEYEKKIKDYDIEENVFLLGYRDDVPELLKLSDILVASSLTEGLPINIQEALACGLPTIATMVRGHTDLITNNENGFLFDVNNKDVVINAVLKLYNDKMLYKRMSGYARKSVLKFDINKVINEYLDIFLDKVQKYDI